MNLAGPWPIRVLWLLLPFAAAPAIADALSAHSDPVRLAAATIAWAGWTVGVVAVLVPRTLGLTALRTLAPAAAALGIWAASGEVAALPATAALLSSCAGTVAALLPTTGDAFVNGSAYGDERRFALRPPLLVLLGPVPLVWVLTVAGVSAGPLLLAARQWAPGVILCVLGPIASLAAFRSLHQLARRWVVFVPAGLVVHDPAGVVPQLMRRSSIARIGPAPAGTGALDLTAGALGLALEVQLREAATIEVRSGPRRRPKAFHATEVMFTPSRPGAVLAEAARRSLPVG